MPRQFSPDALVRLLLNVERRVVREALTDERLADHEIWIKKDEILKAIANIHGPDEVLTDDTMREFALRQWKAALTAVRRAKANWDRETGIIARLMGAAATVFEVIFEHIIKQLDDPKAPGNPVPDIIEFPLVPSNGASPPAETPGLTPAQVTLLREAIRQLLFIPPAITSARRQLTELFFEIDPVLQLLQSGILSELTTIDTARARAMGEINKVF